MIVTSKKSKGVIIKRVFLANRPIEEGDIIRYYFALTPIAKVIRRGKSIINDLTKTEEEIFSSFSKSCKYKINRAAREGVCVSIYDATQITDQMIEDFVDFSIEFHKTKDLPFERRDKLVEEFKSVRTLGQIELAEAKVGEKVVVYHTHYVDDERAFLKESVSLYRVENDVPKNLVGMANRYLHFEEMKYFKRCGIKIYDWGGAGESEEVKTITEFKESFGGEKISVYDSVHCRTLKGKISNVVFSVWMHIR